MTKLLTILFLFFATATASGSALAQGDPEEGQNVFKRCASCHRVGPDAKNAVGPVLNGVIGREAGTAPGYQYSPLNRAAGSQGLVWTEDAIFAYLEDPSGFLKKFLEKKGQAEIAKGATKMVFKLADERERRDVIAFLKKHSPPAK